MRSDVKPAMVCSDDLVMWSGFPKGLRVLLLDEDRQSAAETRLKLEAMDYVVYSYYNEKDALEAISNKAESFHVAIIEVTSGNSDESSIFLEMAKDLPTVVISDECCLNTMMKCIALGATEFLQKPLSDDKLRNIWQHVVHKAFNTGGNLLSKSLKPIKETVASMLQLQPETTEHKIELPSEAENSEKNQENACDDMVANEIFQEPSTPQLIQGGRLLNDEGCQERYNCSTERESTENTKSIFEQRNFESKSVDNTCNELSDGIGKLEVSPHRVKEGVDDDEVDSADGSKTDECGAFKEASLPSSYTKTGEPMESYADDPKKKNSLISTNSHLHGKKGNRKRMKVDWTPELHRRFVQAVEQLGIDQAIPSKILELMSVEGLTRHNVASHLQKFRMHRRHILPKDVDRRWQTHRDPASRGYVQKPIMAYPPYHSNYSLPQNQVYPVWGHPNYFTPTYQMWGNAGFQPWHPPLENWHWKGYHALQADAWGCPMLPQYSQCPQIPPMIDDFDASRDKGIVLKESYSPNSTKEVIDEVVKEVMNKPWLPLPIGLKPPSTDSILAELHRNGIPTIPPSNTATTSYR